MPKWLGDMNKFDIQQHCEEYYDKSIQEQQQIYIGYKGNTDSRFNMGATTAIKRRVRDTNNSGANRKEPGICQR